MVEDDKSLIYPKIIPFLKSKSSLLKKAAAQSLINVPFPYKTALVSQLSDSLKNEKSTDLVLIYIDTLAFNFTDKNEEIVKPLLYHRNPLVREKAQWALEYMKKQGIR